MNETQKQLFKDVIADIEAMKFNYRSQSFTTLVENTFEQVNSLTALKLKQLKRLYTELTGEEI